MSSVFETIPGYYREAGADDEPARCGGCYAKLEYEDDGMFQGKPHCPTCLREAVEEFEADNRDHEQVTVTRSGGINLRLRGDVETAIDVLGDDALITVRVQSRDRYAAWQAAMKQRRAEERKAPPSALALRRDSATDTLHIVWGSEDYLCGAFEGCARIPVSGDWHLATCTTCKRIAERLTRDVA
jgi:hypothetical protein